MKNRKTANFSDRLAKMKQSGAFLLLPSVLGMILCAAMLVGTSWAWFVSSVHVPQTITVANFYVTPVIVDEEGTLVERTAEGSYSLRGNTTYEIALTASSTASGGYCIVRCGEQTYYTEQIFRAGVLSFTITPDVDTNCSFVAMWGSYAGEPNLVNESVLGEKLPELPAETTAPTEEATDPLEEPTQPPTEPSQEATEPATAPTEPETLPEEGTEPETTEPSEEPTQPLPTEPESIAEPTEPEASTEPPEEPAGEEP